jgi:hypothetical protein
MAEISEQLTDEALLESLGSERCPACGGGKQRKNTFCAKCYYRVPARARPSLYRRLGHGYREAVAAAMQLLGKTQFLLPEES